MNGPALLTGVVLLLYWGQVLRMARRAKRRTGRAANFVPAERVGWWLRWVWQPVVWLWIALPLLADFNGGPLPVLFRLLFREPALQWIGAAGVCAMWIGSVRCWQHMGRSWRMGINPGEVTPLVITGPFARVRHPIYALSQAMMACTVVVVPSPLMLIVGVLHIGLLHWEAAREESHLARVHGAAYEGYRSAVGRFVPRRWRRYVPAPA